MISDKKETVISRQIIRSGTSIGAISMKLITGKADFISKIQIALKETAETEYWLRLLMLSEYIKDILLILLQARKYLLVPGCVHARNPHHKRPLF